jgi:hypothetical protein
MKGVRRRPRSCNHHRAEHIADLGVDQRHKRAGRQPGEHADRTWDGVGGGHAESRTARYLVRLLAAAVAVTLTALATPAVAIDQSKGRPGFCPNATGVTVVVDFQQLGGTTIVRCFPHSGPGTGLDALEGAGFQVEGTRRWGKAFICRIENRPSAVEEIPIDGDAGYKESCLDTSPAQAYWSYWHAGNNCPWVYSQWGVKNRDLTLGGFEGWSFSLNATADTNPAPRIAAVRPGTAGGACNAVEEPGPTTNDPNERQPSGQDSASQPNGGGQAVVPRQNTGGGTAPAAPGATARAGLTTGQPAEKATGSALPPPRLRSTATAADPAANAAYTGGEDAEDVNEVIRRQSAASRYAPWAAGAAVVLLAAATWWIARRRSRARNA